MMHLLATGVLALALTAPGGGPDAPAGKPIEDRVEHHYAENDGVRLHYVSLGEGPLVVMLHGFPDFWYTWRHQMEALATDHQVVAVDLRGYNRSDRPAGVEQYDMSLLVGDVAAVIRDVGRDKAVICGHDWGGAIAWSFAMYVPQMTERLMICNLPHPNGIRRELATNPRQRENSTYARNFQEEGAHETLTAEGLAGWVTDPDARARYVEAFRRSDFEAMLNYYKRNYPRLPDRTEGDGAADADAPPAPPPPSGPRVQCPVLMIHGLEDRALLASGLNDTWEWVDADLTIVTIPGAGHFVQQDAADLVSRSMRAWLDR
jgi:pimeloyl-ACP methyl ester carboxylesterase